MYLYRSDLVDGNRPFVHLPRRHCAGLLATPWVGVLQILNRAKYSSSPDFDVLRDIFLGNFYNWFNLSSCLAVVRSYDSVLNAPSRCIGLQFSRCKLRTIVCDQLLGDTILRHVWLQLFHHSQWLGVGEWIYLQEVRLIANGDGVLFDVISEKVCSNFLPCSLRISWDISVSFQGVGSVSLHISQVRFHAINSLFMPAQQTCSLAWRRQASIPWCPTRTSFLTVACIPLGITRCSPWNTKPSVTARPPLTLK